jgi:RNA polymerase sigma factor (sigma-70 family)
MGLYNKRGALYKPLSYLFRAVENKTKSLVKSNQSRLKRQYYYSSNEDNISEANYSISLEDFKALYRLIELLPPRGKLVLKMYLKGISGQEISDKLKMQPSTVRSQTQHVFKLLKNKMDNHSHIKTQ